jgi:zinc protease
MTGLMPTPRQICLGLLFAVATAAAPPLLHSLTPDSSTPIPCTHYRLKNGLQVILAEDYSLPLVTVAVTYRVGSADDPPGKAGLAYLLENLMFLGSLNVNQMQHIAFVNRIGGQLSASVKEDRTQFWQTVPSNHLALVLWLESDRMRSLQPSPAKVESSKGSLIEEFRQRTLQDPFANATLAFERILYPGFAFGHPAFGLENDLRSITVEDVRAFHDTHYSPNNAVLCICGHIDKIKVRELVARYFESIPRGREPQKPAFPRLYEKTSIEETYHESTAAVPGFWLGFRVTSPNPGDLYALTILDYILFRGHSSRFYKRLWQRERLVLSMTGGLESRSGLLAFRLFATANNDILIDRSLKAIFSELQKVKSSFVGDEELTKAKNIFLMDYFSRLSTTLDKAIFLSDAWLSLKNFDDFPAELNKYLQVTPQLLVGLANRYLTKDNAIITLISKQ